MHQVNLLPHQIALIGIEQRSRFNGAFVAAAVAGGVLAELALMERIALRRNRVTVIDPRPTDEPILDEWLAQLQSRNLRPVRFISKAGTKAFDQAHDELAEAGYVSPRKKIFGITRTPKVLKPEAKQEVVSRIRRTIADLEHASAREVSLAGLSCQAGLWSKMLPEVKLRHRGRLEKQLRKQDWVVDAVHRWRAAVQTAVVSSN